jgi:N utilization substance protein B
MIDVGANNPEEALHNVAGDLTTLQAQEFCSALVRGVVSRKEELSVKLSPYLINWQLERLAPVVRNVLLMALFEILHMEDIPAAVTINEAVELTRLYQDEESSRFVNAVLDRLRLSDEMVD